jgi:hypothetical protein
MPPLADLQRQMAGAILDGCCNDMSALAASPIGAANAFAVHRDTVLGGLVSALRLTFPTIAVLVGEAFFDQAAGRFARQQPPTRANLATYGEDFPAFLEQDPHAAALTYLGDVARLDLAVARTLAGPDAYVRREMALDPQVRLSLPAALTLLMLRSPADLIRDGVEANDDEALGAIDLGATPRWLAVWRSGRVAVVQPLSLPAGRFLAAVLAGASAEGALAAAIAEDEPAAILPAIQSEVFAGRFARIIQTQIEEALP